MKNPYLPKILKIEKIQKLTPTINLLRLKWLKEKDKKNFYFEPVQFVMVGVPGFGEAPFGLCSSPYQKDFIEIAVRKVGLLTKKIHKLNKGDIITLRGPYGQGFSIKNMDKNKDLWLITGGCGIVPFRALILEAFRLKYYKIHLFYGVRNYEELLFKEDLKSWRKKIKVSIILEKPPKNWKGPKGLITQLLTKRKIKYDTQALLCGPPIMYKFVVPILLKQGINPANVLLNLERRMHCALGICQHCAVSSQYVCKEGPIFAYPKLSSFGF